jgi:hypothetical protein
MVRGVLLDMASCCFAAPLMKTCFAFLLPVFVFLALPLRLSAAPPAKKAGADAFEAGMRQAMADYKKGDHEAVTAKLRELLKLMEAKGAAKVGEVLPEFLENWEGESLKRDDLSAVGGGICLSRLYKTSEGRSLTAKVIKDSPLVNMLMVTLANEDLLRASNRKVHRISGEPAVMEGEHKLQMVVDGRIYVEISGDEETGEKELIGFARKLDLQALKGMK